MSNLAMAARDVEAVVSAIQEADDGEARELERRAMAETDNGAQPGDPEDQPANDAEALPSDAAEAVPSDDAEAVPIRTGAQDVIRQAKRWVGFIEGPRANETPFGKWYGLDLQPYCAMALSMWSSDAGLPIPASTSKGYAYTPSGAAWFKGQGRWGTRPRVGAHVFFRFSGDRIHHVGLVTGVNPGGSIDTIEANTSRGAVGSQRDGGGVWRRRRSTGIVGYGYPPYHHDDDVAGVDQGNERRPDVVLLRSKSAPHTTLLVGGATTVSIHTPADAEALVRAGVPLAEVDQVMIDRLVHGRVF